MTESSGEAQSSAETEADFSIVALRHARRVVIFVVGTTVCLFGVAMMVLPGPGVLGVALGVSILATEFGWARRLLRRAKQAVGVGDSKSDEPGPDSL